MSKYQATIDYLFQQLPMFQRQGAAAMKKDLTNSLALSKWLNHPEKQYPTIHLAGTNGKGSTAHILAAIFQAAGYKVGLYTSPHYIDFRERIKVNGEYISEQAVIDFTEKLKADHLEIQPSFFEITFAMSTWYFAEQNVDIAIIETGLGGRLDSTNIISPLLSVITNIGYDHQQFLGETLTEIAGEKAGIIKKNTPVVIGEKHDETIDVFKQKSIQENTSIYFAEDNFRVEQINYLCEIKGFKGLNFLKTDLLGPFQHKNIKTALTAIQVIEKHTKYSFTTEQIKTALATIKSTMNYKGRWQILGNEPTIIADSAHNKHGLELVLKTIKEQEFNQLHVVLGFVNDKKLDETLTIFPKNATYYFCKPNIIRGLNADELQQKANKFGLIGNVYDSVQNALYNAKKNANKNDLIYVGGSTFVVAEVI